MTMSEKSIADNNAKFCAALAAGDASAVAAVYAPDAQLLAPGAELITGRDAIENFWKSGIAAGICGCELTTLSVEQRDDLAVEVGRYALRIQPEGSQAVVDLGKCVVVHRRATDGTWQWGIDIFNSNGS